MLNRPRYTPTGQRREYSGRVLPAEDDPHIQALMSRFRDQGQLEVDLGDICEL